MPTKTKPALTETIVLRTASVRRNGHVLPLPEAADFGAPKVIKLLKRMLDGGLFEERRTAAAKGVWRTDTDGQGYLLRVTKLGRTTASASAQDEVAAEPEIADLAPAPEIDRAPGGKLGQVLSAVRAGTGASIGDLIALTGWLPHTVRASLTRLRQSGVPIELTGDHGHKRYIATQEAGQ